MNRRTFASSLLGLALQNDERGLTAAQREEFLKSAKVIERRPVGKGVTAISRLTLTDGVRTHDAAWQTIDVYRAQLNSFENSETNFRDSYRYSIAAYRLDRLLGLYMVPTTVERSIAGNTGALTWWIDDVLMDETERRERKVMPPDQVSWSRQLNIVRVFDQLIYNTDRNTGNLLITRDWQLWMIDHTRAFRLYYDLREPGRLIACDRALLDAMKKLDARTLGQDLGRWLTSSEIKGLLRRRDKIVAHFTAAGEPVLYSVPRRE